MNDLAAIAMHCLCHSQNPHDKALCKYVRELKAALLDFGEHQPGCMSHRHGPNEPEPSCDCGLAEALHNA